MNRENALNSPLYNLTHSHAMSPMGYTKSPITSATAGSSGCVSSAGAPGSMTLTHTNNIGGSGVSGGGGVGVNMAGIATSYSCNNPYGLKTVDGSGINSSVGINSLNAAGGVGSVGSSNALCSSSSLSVTPNVNVSGAIGCGGGNGPVGGNGMGAIPGEGPPTPTQELDLSGSSSIEQQQRKCKKKT